MHEKNLEQNKAMKRTLVLFGILVIILCVRAWYQQKAIDSLIEGAYEALEYDRQTEMYVQAIHRTLQRHIEEGCISQSNEGKIIQRLDLAMRRVENMTREFQ